MKSILFVICTCLQVFQVGVFATEAKNVSFKGTIGNYAIQPLSLYRCYKDTLLLSYTISTGKNGEFSFELSKKEIGLFQVVLQNHQSFYILNDGNPIKVKTTYLKSPFYNIAADSLVVMKSEENKQFYEFQQLQRELNIANTWLLKMMRLYPQPDAFHPEIEKEYFKRHKAMQQFMDDVPVASKSPANMIAKAFYQPHNPDWKQPDPWRDSIIAVHYFDYFNPADSLYIFTNILAEKMEIYLRLHANKQDNYGQPIYDDKSYITAVDTFLKAVSTNQQNFEFCLNYFLKKFDKEHKDNIFLSIYDKWVETAGTACEPTDASINWARNKVSLLQGVQVGSTAPDFELMEGKLSLHGLKSDYTLLVFWASWCSHCTQVIPKIKQVTDSINANNKDKIQLMTVAVSLDTDEKKWQQFVQQNNLFTWFNTSELEGWKGKIPKSYNIYATPTLILLDENKKIIAKPQHVKELGQLIKSKR